MASLQQFTQGTQQVLPTALTNYLKGDLKVESVRITNMLGVKTKIISATIRGSTGENAYNVVIMFTGLKDPENDIPKVNATNAVVRCQCESFYFYFAYPDRLISGLYGGNFRPYVRKTNPADGKYPPKNPGNIPGICKHLLLLTRSLINEGIIQ